MAANTSPQVISFVNNQLRPTVDQLGGALESIKKLLLVWPGVTSLVPATTDQVEDGSQTDGRPIWSNDDIISIMAVFQSMITLVEQGTSTFPTLTGNQLELAIMTKIVNAKPAF
jgi:hypothetical protein